MGSTAQEDTHRRIALPEDRPTPLELASVPPSDAPDAPDAPDDLAILLATQRDPSAFAPLYERYAPAVHGYCLRRLGDADAAADATSQIFVRALQRLDTFRPSPASTVRSWLFAIAHNTVVDTHRRNVFRRQRSRSLDQPYRDASGSRDGTDQNHSPGERLVATDPTTNPEEQALAAEAISCVRQALLHVPERQRQIMELRMAGLTGDEIAAVLGMTLGAVKSAQFRAFGTLRPRLDEFRDADGTPRTPAEDFPNASRK